MTSTTFETAAKPERRPQDHGPLTPAETQRLKEQHASFKAISDAYHNMCVRHGPGGLK